MKKFYWVTADQYEWILAENYDFHTHEINSNLTFPPCRIAGLVVKYLDSLRVGVTNRIRIIRFITRRGIHRYKLTQSINQLSLLDSWYATFSLILILPTVLQSRSRDDYVLWLPLLKWCSNDVCDVCLGKLTTWIVNIILPKVICMELNQILY